MIARIDALLSAPLHDVPGQAGVLDDAGVDGLFTYEAQTDPFLPLARAADRTTGFLYTNIAVALPRSPLHLAQVAWDLQRLTEGRFALGLGTQIKPHIERRYGGTWERPLAQMREIVDATKAIFATWQDGAPMAFEGRWTRHTLMPPTLTPPPLPSPVPPIWLAALGPKMTALAGEVADGLLVHPFTSRAHVVDRTLPNLGHGLAAAGRRRADVTVTIGAIVGLFETEAERDQAAATVRSMLGFYGSTPAYRPVLDAHGWGDLQPELRRLTKEGRWAELGDLFSDEQVTTLAVLGRPADAGRELRARFGDLADRIALSIPMPARPELLAAMIDTYRAT